MPNINVPHMSAMFRKARSPPVYLDGPLEDIIIQRGANHVIHVIRHSPWSLAKAYILDII